MHLAYLVYFTYGVDTLSGKGCTTPLEAAASVCCGQTALHVLALSVSAPHKRCKVSVKQAHCLASVPAAICLLGGNAHPNP
jgi:hypothetical protein